MHYFCSDIHGQYRMFLKLLELIRFSSEDHMYILGDVIDRGPEPISIILEIMRRDNMTLLMGNHEHMMLTSFATRDREDISLWMYNGGRTTLQQLKGLDPRTSRALLSFLRERPLVLPDIRIGGHRYYLAHACHAPFIIDEPLPYEGTSQEVIDSIVWSKDYRNPDPPYLDAQNEQLYRHYREATLVIGHSMSFVCSYGRVTRDGFCRIARARHGHLINLDCGCAAGNTLGCLRAEDGKEFYVDANPLSPSIMEWRKSK